MKRRRDWEREIRIAWAIVVFVAVLALVLVLLYLTWLSFPHRIRDTYQETTVQSNVIDAANRFAAARLEADVIRANEAATQAAVDRYVDLLIQAHQRQETGR